MRVWRLIEFLKMNKKKVNSSRLSFGWKIKEEILLAVLLLVLFFVFYGFRRIYVNNKLEKGKTEIVCAEIIDVGIKMRGGLGIKSKIGYVKFRYFVNGREVVHSSESFQIRDNIEKYQIGYCIEILASLEDENVYKWNELREPFKCP